MPALNIDNTATAWNEFLLSLSAEAKADSEAANSESALRNILDDLSRVAKVYAGRLNVPRVSSVAAKQVAELANVTPPAQVAPALVEPVAEEIQPAALANLPGWALDALSDMRREIDDLRARVSSLEGAQLFAPSEGEDVDAVYLEFDRAVWNSVDQARAALVAMVKRQHEIAARARQQIASRVAHLALTPESARDSAVDAELRQHKTRVEEYGQIDVLAATKIDEIASIDDLEVLRGYDVKAGFPE